VAQVCEQENKAETFQSELTTRIFCFEMQLTSIINHDSYVKETVLRGGFAIFGFADLASFWFGFSLLTLWFFGFDTL